MLTANRKNISGFSAWQGVVVAGTLLLTVAFSSVVMLAQEQPAGAVPRPASQAPAAAEDNSIKINVGVGAAKQGEPLDIPVTLSGPEDTSISSAVVHVSYPTDALKYNDSEKGLAVDLADGDVKVTTSPDKSDPKLTDFELTISSKTCIKPGILAYFKFDVPQDAKKGEVPMKLLDYKATNCPGNTPTNLAQGDDGLITIFLSDETIPVIGCFFFTH